MNNQFTSNSNKELLWNLLIEQNSFNGINPKYKSTIQNAFENTIININNENINISLIDKNKEVIKKMLIFINSLHNNINNSNNNTSHNGQTVVNLNQGQKNYTYEDLQRIKIEKFDNELKQKQIEFDNIIKKDKPKQMDFSDKLDEKIGDKMDLLISEKIALRENQLKQILKEHPPPIMSNTSDSSTKINSNTLQMNNNMNKTDFNPVLFQNKVLQSKNNEIIHLSIGNDINLKSDSIIDLNKRVTFNDSEPTVYNYEKDNEELQFKTNPIKLNTFLNKLKNTSERENEDTNLNINNTNNINKENDYKFLQLDNKLDNIINLLSEIKNKLDLLDLLEKK